jgi:hypothetical protein
MIASSRRLSEACQVSIPAGQGHPFSTTAERVVRTGNPIRRHAGVLIKQILGCVLVASPFALLLALRLGARQLDPHYTVLALGAVVVLVLMIIVPSVASRQDDTARVRGAGRDVQGRGRPAPPRDARDPAELP